MSRKSRKSTNVKNYKRSIDFYCSRYFISDKRNKKIFTNDDLADGTNIQFASSHKRKSARPGGKKLPRKTESDLSEKREDSCGLSFKIVVGNDDFYYIKRYPYKANECLNKNCLHTNHIKIPKEKRQYMTKHLREIDLKLISDCDKAGFTTQMTSSLLLASTSKHWLSSQVEYILTRESKKILKDGIADSKLSSASKLINYLEAEEDVTFVTLTDTHDRGILVRTKRKGRPSTEEKLQRLHGSDTYEELLKNLELTGTPEILLACAWMTDSELRQLQMFPEVWYADITNQSNNKKRQLIVLAGKNGMNQGFTGLRAFLPSEQYWVFEWFWNVCLIQLLTTVLVRRNRVIITDGDPNLYEPLRLAQSKEISP